jgi:glycosyltransferase involved in cell wall biosynthesis
MSPKFLDYTGYNVRILILTQYYPPEIGAAAVRLSRLARLLAADGHTVTVLTSMPNYPTGIIEARYRGKLFCREMLDGVDVARVWVYATPGKGNRARLLNQISFMAMAALRGTALPQPDVILVESHPLFVCIAGGWLKLVKRAPVVLNVSDLWPESAVATGALRADSLMVRLAERVERWAYRDAAHVVGMTRGISAGIVRVSQKPERVTTIRNGVDLERFRPNRTAAREAIRARYELEGCFVVAHIGNMSLTYDFDMILAAAGMLPEYKFFFVGGGSQAGYVEVQVRERGLANVVLAGIFPHEQMPEAWAAADVCLISMGDHSLADTTLPAKLYEAFATGTPIVAGIRGEGAALIKEANAGIVIPVGDSAALTDALGQLAANPEQRETFSKGGRAYAEANFAPEAVKARYVEVMEGAARGEY